MSWYTPTHTHTLTDTPTDNVLKKVSLLFFIFDYCAIYQLKFYKFAQIIQIIRLSLHFNALVKVQFEQ